MLQVCENNLFGFPVVEVAGNLDMGNAHMLQEALLGAMQSKPERLGVDLRGVTSADLAGITIIEWAAQAVRTWGARLVLLGASLEYQAAAQSSSRWLRLDDLCAGAPAACSHCPIMNLCERRLA